MDFVTLASGLTSTAARIYERNIDSTMMIPTISMPLCSSSLTVAITALIEIFTSNAPCICGTSALLTGTASSSV